MKEAFYGLFFLISSFGMTIFIIVFYDQGWITYHGDENMPSFFFKFWIVISWYQNIRFISFSCTSLFQQSFVDHCGNFCHLYLRLQDFRIILFPFLLCLLASINTKIFCFILLKIVITHNNVIEITSLFQYLYLLLVLST